MYLILDNIYDIFLYFFFQKGVKRFMNQENQVFYFIFVASKSQAALYQNLQSSQFQKK